MANPNDIIRDAILRYLHQRHRSARGPRGVAAKISEIHRAMKGKGFAQKDVNSNLDYLIQKEWVREVVTRREFTTPRGTVRESESISYKISDIGIDRLESASVFRREDRVSGLNITNISGVTVVGSDNVIVNTQYSDLYGAVEELQSAVAEAEDIPDEAKLNVVADLQSIKGQLAKPRPDWQVVGQLWSAVKTAVTGAAFVDLVARIGDWLGPLVT